MAAPLVSIVIPTFNRAKLLPRAIESALAQSVPCEVIVADHGSTDDTPSVVARYGERVRYVRKDQDNGPIACWIDGIEAATGEYIHLNYDDDWIDSSYVERTLPLFLPDVAFVYTRAMIHFDGTDITSPVLFHPPGIRNSSDIIRFLIRNRLTISPGCAIFRKRDLQRNLLSEVPGASGEFGKGSGVGEDLLIFLLTARDYPKYAHLGEPLSHFLAHPSSITVSAKLTGKDLKLKRAYAKAKEYFLSLDGQLKRETAWSRSAGAIRWWMACGTENHLHALSAMIARQYRYLILRGNKR